MSVDLVRKSSVNLGGVWVPVRTAATTGGIVDTFVDDVTKPLWYGTGDPANNVGCKYGVPRTTVSTIAQAASANYTNLNVPFQLTVANPGLTWLNCRFTYSYVGDSGGGIFYQMISASNGVKTNLLFCELEPDTPNDRYNGIYGHDIYAYRCAITKTVDGIGAYNSTASTLNMEVACSWVGYLAWYDDDYGAGRPNGHNPATTTPGTHNDGIQWGSSTNLNVHGCFWQGAKYNVLNPDNCILNRDGSYTLATGNGVTPLIASPPNSGATTQRGAQQGQILLGQHSAYYHVGSLTFRNNWLWNFDNGFKLQSDRGSSVAPENASGYSQILDVTVENNIFGGTPRNWGGSQLYYPIRYDNNCWVNGTRQTGGTVITDTNGNVFDSNANVAATYGDGQPIAGYPVRHRIDSVTAV